MRLGLFLSVTPVPNTISGHSHAGNVERMNESIKYKVRLKAFALQRVFSAHVLFSDFPISRWGGIIFVLSFMCEKNAHGPLRSYDELALCPPYLFCFPLRPVTCIWNMAPPHLLQHQDRQTHSN